MRDFRLPKPKNLPKAPKMKRRCPRPRPKVKPRPKKIKLVNIDLQYYGQYRIGLTGKEIKEYLKKRTGRTLLGDLYIRFCKISGVNTVEMGHCEYCGEVFSLMFRNDVERFADVLFLGIPTYFD